jgi:hypothetical protein
MRTIGLAADTCPTAAAAADELGVAAVAAARGIARTPRHAGVAADDHAATAAAVTFA